MSSKKKVIYFMPDNPMSGKAGNTTRLNQLLDYFNNNSTLDVTFVSLRDWGIWKQKDELSFSEKFSNIKLILLDKKYKNNFFKYLFLYKIPYLFKSNSIDNTSWILRNEFQKIYNQENFDIALISYAVWGKILNNKNKNTHTIIDTHDFITAQKRNKANNIGKYFQDEIKILKEFDEIWTYSVEEEYIFDQFTGKKVTLMPISFPKNNEKHTNEYKYDIVYVASNNPHNISGINWFLEKVLPKLQGIKVHIIGKIGNSISDHTNVIKHGLVDNLEEFYTNAKLAICPMLSGTGIKIKVIEALSYGLPVVTNRRGVDGLQNKKNNGCLVTENPQEFANNIIQLSNNSEFYDKIKKEGINYFDSAHNANLENTILDNIFKSTNFHD